MSSYELSFRAPRTRGLSALRLDPLVGIACACVALALLSLLEPTQPTYDPFAWLTWGREILHLNLDTQFGPSWKPLPVLFTTVFGLVPSAAPDLWVAVARAGGLAAIVLAFRVSRRLGGGWAGGLVAAASLAVASEYVRFAAMGDSEGMLVAFVLAGVDLHLSGRRRAALIMGFIACLLRPEAWPFAGLYAVWLAREEPATRRLILALVIAGGAAWFLPELWGSGNPLRAGTRARQPVPGSAAFAHHPLWAVFKNYRMALPWPAEIGMLAALALAAYRRLRGDKLWILAFASLGWMLLVGIMAEAGFTGNIRYLMAPAGLACVVAGVTWARAFERIPAAGALVGIVVAAALLWSPFSDVRADLRLVGQDARKTSRLDQAVTAAGGARAVLRCGLPTVGPFQVTALAWRLDVPIRRVGYIPQATGTVFRIGPKPVLGASWHQVAVVPPWQVMQSCGVAGG